MSDFNALAIYDHEGVKLYKQLLESGNKEEKEEACRGLWTLSFNELVSKAILSDSKILSGQFMSIFGSVFLHALNFTL